MGGFRQGKIRVLCVDDHPLVRDGISFALQQQPDMEVAGHASTGAEAFEEFCKLNPDITLMDLQLPDVNGTIVIAKIRQVNSKARVIALTTYSGDVQVSRALKAGATGYLLKSMLRTELINMIRDVHAGLRRIPAEVAVSMAEFHAIDDLSEREVEVLRSAASGRSNKLIGAHLAISEDTVKAHMKHIMAKLGASDRTHAVLIAMKRGFLDGISLSGNLPC